MRFRREPEFSYLLGWRCDVIPPADESEVARMIRKTSEVSADAIIVAAFRAGGGAREQKRLYTDRSMFDAPLHEDRYRWTSIECTRRTGRDAVERVRDGLITAAAEYCAGMRGLLLEAGITRSGQNVPDGVTHLYVPSIPPFVDEPLYIPPDRRIDQVHQA